MKENNILKTAFIFLLTLSGLSASAQCVQQLGSSTNTLSSLNNRTKQLVVDNNLNTVVFIHRNDVNIQGGDNGVYRYDISTDNGSTWQLNQGNLNPSSVINVNGGRYPQLGIYNPSGNTNPANASLVYHGAVYNGSAWYGYVSGSQQLNGSSSTENYNQAGVTNTNIPGGLCQSTPGVFWTIDATVSGFSFSGFRLMKGVYSSGDINWSVAQEFYPDFNLDMYGSPVIADWNMAFDPTGQKGWIVMLTHLNGPANYVYYPVFYHTTDGGNTWSGPEQLDLSSFASISSEHPNATCDIESDITVDMYGNPHALILVGDASQYAYSFNSAHYASMIDFTNNGTSWSAVKVGQVAPMSNFGSGGVTKNRPQMSRSDDGSKIVYTWVEADLPSSMGPEGNLKVVTYNVPTGVRSCAKSYALICPSSLSGTTYQTTVSANLIEDGGTFRVPVVVTTDNTSAGIQPIPAQYYYLNGLNYTASDFNTAAPIDFLTISTSGQIPFCQGGSAQLTASASSAYLWNTGETTQTITVSGGKYWVVNPTSHRCVSSSNSIAAEAIPLPDVFAYPTSTLCPNGSVDLYAFYMSGGQSVVWSNGATGDIISVTTPGSYTVTVDGCTSPYSVDVQAGSIPANDNRCNAQALTVGVQASFDNTCATVESNEPIPPLVDYIPGLQNGWFDDSFMGYPVLNNTVWFSFIAPSSKAVNILVSGGFDSQLALYSSSNNTCTGTMRLIAANDDGSVYNTSFINQAYCLERGKRYFIQVDGFYGAQGPANILVTAVPNTVTICHQQIGTVPRTLTISGCGLADHLSHGDVVGTCSPLRISANVEDDITAASLTAYPNPTSGRLNVAFDSDVQENYTILVVDVTGRVISTQAGTTVTGENLIQVGMEQCSTGMYFLVLRKGDNVIQTRIIKE